AAAEVLTFVTGDPFFPGGMGTFEVEQDTFLFFEKGPSEPFTLQWATYRDASDQTSLSRIWGGIHPPIDDIPGRRLGADIGVQAFNLATDYFNGDVLGVEENELISQIKLYPNPVLNILQIAHPNTFTIQKIEVFDMASRKVISEENKKLQPAISVGDLTDGVYLATLYTDFGTVVKRFIVSK
ncbi:MAG: hypothetical protein CMC75_10445, partial [Flavobacteriaceae bacterium]|nr:hypothetical protein [Flavobacteriaceae bacterium]